MNRTRLSNEYSVCNLFMLREFVSGVRSMTFRFLTTLLLCGLLLSFSSCAYLKNTLVQAVYSRLQNTGPTMVNLKQMIDRETYFIYGKLIDPEGRYTTNR